MSINRLRIIVFIMVICLTFPIINVNAAENAVTITMSSVGDVYHGGEFTVRLNVSKPSKALAGIEFVLDYDSEYVLPKITENTEFGREMDVFMVSSPDGWEQMCYHSKDNSRYHLRFVMPENSQSYLDTANELVLEIPFIVRTPGSFEFKIENDSILAFGADSAVTSYSGLGSSLGVTAASEGIKLSAILDGESTAVAGDPYNIGISVTNLGDASGIVALEFDVYYDKAIFEPTVKSNTQNEMDIFITSAPQNAWEQMCTLYESEGKYTIRLAANNCDDPSKAEVLHSGGALTLSLPFTVIGGEGSVGSFEIDTTSLIGLNNLMGAVAGTGDQTDVSVTAPIKFSPEQLGYTVKDGYLLYVPEKTNVSDFLAPMPSGYRIISAGNPVTDGYVRTGYTLLDDKGYGITVIVKGDVNGDGLVNIFDCVQAKAIYYGKSTPQPTEILAGAIVNGSSITVFDYLRIKAHYLGKSDINA